MSLKEYSPVLEEDYKKIAQLDYALDDDSNCDDETFESLLSSNTFNINYRIPETEFFQVMKPDGLIGGTMLHASMIYVETFHMQSLIKHGADITIKNADGSTVVHLEVQKSYESYFESWKSELSSFGLHFCHLTNKILSAHIDFNITVNPCDNNGISHFHIACMASNIDAVKFFLEKGASVNETVNQDSPVLPGFTPLHFAVKYCATEVVAELLKFEADVHVKDAKGMSPLHVLIDERLKLLILMEKLLFNKNNVLSKNLKIHFDKNEKLILSLLEKATPSFIDTAGFTSLHALCTLSDTSVVEKFLIDNSVNLDRSLGQNSPLCPGYTALHFASHFNADTVKLLLKKGANMKLKDAKGMTAFDICLQNLKIKDIHSIMMLEPDLKSITFSNNKTKLSSLLHAMADPKTFADFLKSNFKNINTFIPTNSPFSPGNTPLHFAATCTEIPSIHWDSEYTDCPQSALYPDSCTAETAEYLERIKACLDLGADVTLKNDRGFTPLHLTFRSQASKAVQLMSQYHKKICNPIDVDGLSHLHVACAAKNHELVAKLLANGADVNKVTNSNFTVRPHFVKSKSTPLHFAAVVRSPRAVKSLIDNGADVSAKDADGATPLERFFGLRTFGGIKHTIRYHYKRYGDDELEALTLLVRRVAAEIVNRKGSSKLLLGCCRILGNGVLASILKCRDAAMRKVLDSAGITELHVACLLEDIERIGKLSRKRSSIDKQVDVDSPFWAGFTPLHVAVAIKNLEIVGLLLGRGADATLRNAERDTPLHAAFGSCKFELTCPANTALAGMLNSQTDFSVNPVDVGGTSHFHIACARNNVAAVNEFLKHGVDVDQATDYFNCSFRGFTALHFAACFLQRETIEVLIKHGANIHWKTTSGDSLLHSCFHIRRSNEEHDLLYKNKRENVMDVLVKAGVDVNEKNMFGETVLTLLMKTDDFTPRDVDNFLKRGCRVNVFDVNEEGLMAVCLKKIKNLDTYQKLCEQPDTRNIDETGRNAIHNVVSFKRPERVIPIEESFIPVEDYTKVIEKLIRLGLDINCQDNQGLTPLHAAAKMQNITGITGLLKNGADINITDENGNTAFDYSFNVAANSEGNVREVDRRIFKAFAVYMCKLESFGLEIVERNKEVLRRVEEVNPVKYFLGEKARNEIASLKKRRIGSYEVTLFDFLSETGAVAAYPTMLEVQLQAVDEFFIAENLQKEYPVVSCLLFLQYRKALARMRIINSAMDSLKFLIGFDIPDVCSKLILRVVSNKELENLTSCLHDSTPIKV